MLVQRLPDFKVAEIGNKETKLNPEEDLVNRIWAIIDSLEAE